MQPLEALPFHDAPPAGEAQAASAEPRRATAPHETPVDELRTVLNVPVRMRAVLGRTRMDLHRLLRLREGDVLDLDRRAGEPVDIYVNDRFVARGEVVLIDDTLGVTLTEIAHQEG